ncbi:Rtt106-domain-containing protein [Saccharata proteae CBS 121410]|uniref:Rtt106-domain-containing protein n=1 Tax=Saccharata proteae CBS 121410 TaxID=1314787 RepID=A0A9P4HSA4_9PEZI|nr:Rtt106-domain-containing protein [Saccharata proteae CBS 121410]
MATSDEAQITKAFSTRPDLQKAVFDAIKSTPHHTPLFASISAYILDLQSSSHTNGADATSENPTKKRKIDNELPTRAAAAAVWDLKTKAEAEIKDVSFTFPVRKKVEKVEFVGGKGGGLRAVGGGEVLAGVGWGDIDQIFCLPVPEKPKKQWHFVLIPRGNNGLQPAPTDPSQPSPPDQWLWTFSEPPKKDLEAGSSPTPLPTITLLNTYLRPYKRAVVEPRKEVFQSTIPQSQHKGEPGFHVKAFRGSKEGWLYFTNVGIVFGFKKPVLFFGFEGISTTSYTSVLQRTFNLVVGVESGDGGGEEVEFSMIDQVDFAGIDAYVKGRGLNDASLAAGRRGVVYGVNAVKEEENEAVEGDDGETELQKAERALQDQEDEEEEDYDPGSEGESEGSGSSSEEEEEYEGGEGGEEGEEDEEEGGESLVRKELGSDAEDVEVD